MRLAAGGEDRHLVVGHVEADVGARDVVDDDGVEALAGELVAPVVQRPLAVLGGEADQQLAGTPPRRQRRDDVRRRLELQRREGTRAAYAAGGRQAMLAYGQREGGAALRLTRQLG